jgi:hypothetical protein
MPPYAFRVVFFLSKDADLQIQKHPVSVQLGDGRTVEFHRDPTQHGDRGERKIIALARGFATKGEAQTCGARLKTALALTGLILSVGIDVGDDRPISQALGYAEEKAPDDRPYRLPEVHGLQVFPDDRGAVFGGISVGEPVTVVREEQFSELLSQHYRLAVRLTPKAALAVDLYAGSHFQSSREAQFVTLVSAIECLASQEPMPAGTIEIVTRMMDAVQCSSLDAAERSYLRSRLGSLQSESVSRACRRLMRTFCGEDLEREFVQVYEARSKLLHDGVVPHGVNLEAALPKLNNLVRGLLANYVFNRRA